MTDITWTITSSTFNDEYQFSKQEWLQQEIAYCAITEKNEQQDRLEKIQERLDEIKAVKATWNKSGWHDEIFDHTESFAEDRYHNLIENGLKNSAKNYADKVGLKLEY